MAVEEVVLPVAESYLHPSRLVLVEHLLVVQVWGCLVICLLLMLYLFFLLPVAERVCSLLVVPHFQYRQPLSGIVLALVSTCSLLWSADPCRSGSGGKKSPREQVEQSWWHMQREDFSRWSKYLYQAFR